VDSDHRNTDVENAAFDTTMKIIGIVVALLVIVGGAGWYFAG
jgi:hypothetical protein